MTIPFVASVLYFIVLSEHPAGKWIYTVAKVFTVVWPVFCFVLLWRIRLRQPRGNIGPLMVHLKALPLGILTGLLIVGAMYGLMQISIGDVVEASAPAISKKARALGFLEHYIPFAIFLSVLHSLIEEYFWRWFVFGQLRKRLPVVSAAILGSIAFAAHHLVVTAQFFPLWLAVVLSVCVAIGGLLWCWLYQKQGTLAGAWISHLIADVGLMTVGYFLLKP